MNNNISDGVQAVRHTGQRVLERVESAAGEVAKEARGIGDHLPHKNKKPKRKRSKVAGLVGSVVAFVVALTVRKRRRSDADTPLGEYDKPAK